MAPKNEQRESSNIIVGEAAWIWHHKAEDGDGLHLMEGRKTWGRGAEQTSRRALMIRISKEQNGKGEDG